MTRRPAGKRRYQARCVVHLADNLVVPVGDVDVAVIGNRNTVGLFELRRDRGSSVAGIAFSPRAGIRVDGLAVGRPRVDQDRQAGDAQRRGLP